MTARACASSAATSGASAARSKASPPTRVISTSAVPPGKRKTLPVEVDRHAFAYVFEGSGSFRAASQPFGVLTEKTDGVNETVVREQTGNRSLVLFDRGDEVTVQAGDEGIRFLLVSGKPIEEPVAWYGPIVMNTRGRAAAGLQRTAQRHVHQIGRRSHVISSAPPRDGGDEWKDAAGHACANLLSFPDQEACGAAVPTPRRYNS